MRPYAISGTNAVANATKSLLGLISTAAIRPMIFEIIFGSTATPADNALEWQFQRFTVAGTSTAVTPQVLDPGDPAATATAGKIYTVEPTYTAGAIILDIPLNQRSTQRWVSSPRGELILPAVAANGLGVQPIHASFTGNVTATIQYRE